MTYQTILSPEVLHSHRGDPDWVVVDCRFDLTDPSWGRKSYEDGHIPGAIYAHLDEALSGPVSPRTGRHPLPDAEIMAERLGQMGISNTSQVVAYDTTGGGFAARLWWLLRYLGHGKAALLDGGFTNWLKRGYPTSSGHETRSPGRFSASVDPYMLVDTGEIERIRSDKDYILIDARAPERFRGEKEPIDPVAGHIPGALNRFHGLNLSADGTFKPVDQLREEFSSLVGAAAPENIVVYCGSGVTSCHHILALEMVGVQGVRLYPGSWSEWIRDPNRPVAKGA